MAVIETVFQFVKVGVQMLHADTVVGADDRTLQEAPDALDSVRVNVAAHPFLNRVIYALVAGVFVRNSDIGGKLVGVDRFRVGRGVLRNKLVERVLARPLDDLKANLAAALDRPDRNRLVSTVAPALTTNLTADVGFVHFNDPAQGLGSGVLHGSADAVAQIPCRAVGNTDCALNLAGGNSLLALRDKVDGNEPFPERQMTVVEDRSRGHRELIAAVIAAIRSAILDRGSVLLVATRANRTFRPAQLFQVFARLLVAAKLFDQLDEVHV